MPIDVFAAGLYEIVAEIAEGPDYGDYFILVDGQPTNMDTRKPSTSEIPLPGPEVFHNYLTELYVARDRTLGMFQLAAGRHTISFVVTGKDPHSVGYNLGINDVVLEKVMKTPEIPDVREHMAANTGGVLYRGQPLGSYLARLRTAPPQERPILIRAIGSFGSAANYASPELIAALSDPSPAVRSAAAAALAQIGPHNSSAAVPALARALSDPAPEVRDLAAIALGSMGPKAAPAVPELTRALNDSVDYVRAPAADALGAIGSKASAAVASLAAKLKLMTSDQGFVLTSVAYALGDIGSAASDAVPALQQVLAQRRVGGAAREALLKIQGKPVPLYHP